MAPTFMIGIIIITGFIVGELVSLIRLPKATGYILAGILLHPHLPHFIPSDFVDQTSIETKLSRAVITFSVTASLYVP